MPIERQAARFLVDVADAVAAVKSGKTNYGEFYVSEVRIGFDGEDSSYRIVPDEADGYAITEIDLDAARSHAD